MTRFFYFVLGPIFALLMGIGCLVFAIDEGGFVWWGGFGMFVYMLIGLPLEGRKKIAAQRVASQEA